MEQDVGLEKLDIQENTMAVWSSKDVLQHFIQSFIVKEILNSNI